MSADTRILIVDQETGSLHVHSRVLAAAGYQVLRARSGAEALRIVAEQCPDVVLLDNSLPDMEGVEVCRRLKEARHSSATQVILTSAGKGSGGARVVGLEGGADGYIPRPITDKQLIDRVEAIARTKRENRFRRQHGELAALNRIITATLRNRTLDDRLRVIVEEVVGLLRVEAGGIYLFDGKHPQLRAWRGISEGCRAALAAMPPLETAEWLRERRSVQEPLDVEGLLPSFIKREGIQSHVSIPLTLPPPLDSDTGQRGECLGAIALVSHRLDGVGQREVSIVEGLAETLALAIDHARHSFDAEERLKRLKVLREIDRAIIARSSLRDIMSVVVSSLPREVSADAVALTVLDSGDGSRIFAIRLPNGAVIEEEAFTVADSIMQWFIERKQPVLIEDLSLDPRVTARRGVVRQYGLVSYLGVPLVVRDQTIGILQVLSTRPVSYDDEEVEFFRTLAGQVAIALESARMLEHIQEAERKYRSIFENAVEGIYQTTPDGRLITANPAMARILEYESPEDLVARVHDVEAQLYADPRQRDEFRRMLDAEDVATNIELQVLRRDGRPIWVTKSCRAIRDEHGVLLHYEGMIKDVSEKKQAEAALRESQQFLQTLVETVPTMIVLTDSEGHVRMFNRNSEHVTGYRREEVLGKTVAELCQSTNWDRLAQPSATPSELFGPREDIWTTKSGQQRLIEWRYAILATPNGDKPFVLGAGVDITELRRGEQFVAGQNQVLRQLAAGRPLSEVLSKLAVTVERESRDVRCCFLLFEEHEQRLRLAAAPSLPEEYLRLLDGLRVGPRSMSCGAAAYWARPVISPDIACSSCWTEHATAALAHGLRACWSQPIISPKGSVLGTFCVYLEQPRQPTPADLKMLEEVTQVAQIAIDRRLAEESLQSVNRHLEHTLAELESTQHQVVQQERLRALGQMASGVAHDFNNALSPILGYSEMLLLDPGLTPRMRDQLTLIHTSARDAASVVERLRHFYHPPGDMELTERVDLGALLRQIPDLTRAKWHDEALRTGREVDVELEVEDVPSVCGLANELRELLTNLVINAVDAMPNGGRIKLRLATVGHQAVVEVSDNGTGMTEEVRRRCFEPFFTTKGIAGTGLGLSVCHGIVQRHHGSIDIESALGQGTTFRIHLPISPEHDGEGDRAPTATLERWRILFIDDDPRVRPVVANMLQQLGQQVDLAHAGSAGLTMFREHEYDLVMTDLGMPRMDGYEVTQIVKTIKPEMQVILVTGWRGAGDLEAVPTGHVPDLVLEKPVTLASLREALIRVQTRVRA